MKKYITLVIVSIMLVSCGGRAPNPVQSHLPTDNSLSCKQIESELSGLQGSRQSLGLEKSSRRNGNIMKGVGGFLLIGIPWLFLDFKGAPETEERAINNRIGVLQRIANNKDCNLIY